MSGVNRVILVGNLGADPEVRYTPSGQAVANFRIATSESWTDKAGQKQERTEWHRIVAWNKTAENCGEYLKKGRQVFIEGKLQTREWTDKENKRNWTTEVVADKVVFLGRGDGQHDHGGQAGSGQHGGQAGSGQHGGQPAHGQSNQGAPRRPSTPAQAGPTPDDFGSPDGYDGGRGATSGGPSEDDLPF